MDLPLLANDWIERRRSERVALRFEIEIDGAVSLGYDLSVGGFAACDCTVQPGQVEDLMVRLIHPEFLLCFAASARPVGSDPVRRITRFEFVNLKPQPAFVLDAIVTAVSAQTGRRQGDDFLKYAADMADRAVHARCMTAPLAI